MATKRINELTQQATAADLVAGNFFALDTTDVTKRLPADKVLANPTTTATDISAVDIVAKDKTTGEVVKVDGSGVAKASDVDKKASIDGVFKPTANYFRLLATSNKLLSKDPLRINKGAEIIFDGLSSAIKCAILKRVGSTYHTLSDYNSLQDYILLEDVEELFFDLAKIDGSAISIDDFTDGSLVINYPMSELRINNLEKSLSDYKEYAKEHFATRTGADNLSRNVFEQKSTKIFSIPLKFRKGTKVVFNKYNDFDLCYILVLKEGSTTSYNPLASGQNFSYVFEKDYDNVYIDVRNNTGSKYYISDFNEESFVVYYPMSESRIDSLDERVAALENESPVSTIEPYYAHIKDGKLVAGQVNAHLSPSERESKKLATYLAVEMNAACVSCGCKFVFEGSQSDKGIVAMAFMPNTWDKKVSGDDGITGKCLHLTYNHNTHKVKIDIIATSWTGGDDPYYYKNICNQVVQVGSSSEHALSWTISGENINVVIDGNSYQFTNTSDKSLSLLTGKFCFIEHYANNNLPSIDLPKFTAFRAVDNDGGVLYDNFKRQDGVPTLSAQGYKYISLSNDSLYGENNTNSYPNW